MTIYAEVQAKLETHASFRERRYRGKGLVILALRSLNLSEKYERGEGLSHDEMIRFANKYDSYRHEYDAVQREHENLQGADYRDGKRLAQEKMIEFGYESGYKELIKHT